MKTENEYIQQAIDELDDEPYNPSIAQVQALANQMRDRDLVLESAKKEAPSRTLGLPEETTEEKLRRQVDLWRDRYDVCYSYLEAAQEQIKKLKEVQGVDWHTEYRVLQSLYDARRCELDTQVHQIFNLKNFVGGLSQQILDMEEGNETKPTTTVEMKLHGT